MNLTVQIDGDKLVEWFQESDTAAVIFTGETYIVTAPIHDILNGAIENMTAVFE